MTKTIAAMKEAVMPQKLVEKSVEHASITPTVSGISDRYVARLYLMRNTIRYARTVNNGESPLMVCTNETGIFSVAYELSRCPNSWKTESGSAVYMTSHVGRRKPFFNAGTAFFMAGNTDDNAVRIIHQEKTEKNWRIVKVAGFGYALRIDFEEVFVSADVMYQVMHRIWEC